MKYRCKSMTLSVSPNNPVCPFKPCEIELSEFQPRACLYTAVYQEWEKIEIREAKMTPKELILINLFWDIVTTLAVIGISVWIAIELELL